MEISQIVSHFCSFKLQIDSIVVWCEMLCFRDMSDMFRVVPTPVEVRYNLHGPQGGQCNSIGMNYRYEFGDEMIKCVQVN